MNAAIPDFAELEPATAMSIDELQALQLTRMQWSLDHAYNNVASFRDKCDAKEVHPSDFDGEDLEASRVQWNDRQAHYRWLYPQGH